MYTYDVDKEIRTNLFENINKVMWARRYFSGVLKSLVPLIIGHNKHYWGYTIFLYFRFLNSEEVKKSSSDYLWNKLTKKHYYVFDILMTWLKLIKLNIVFQHFYSVQLTSRLCLQKWTLLHSVTDNFETKMY